MARHLLAVFLDTRRSALAAVCVELARRGVDVVSLNATSCALERGSCVQLVVDLPERGLEMLIKQLNRLIDVVCVVDLTQQPAHQRMSMLVTLRAGWRNGLGIMELVHRLRADVVESGRDGTTVFVSTTPECRADVMKELSPFGIAEVVESAPFGTRRIRNLYRRALRSAPSGSTLPYGR